MDMKPQGGGGFGWSGGGPVGCIDLVTGALKTNHGFDYSFKIQLTPAATATRDGVTYVTRLRGTYVGTLEVNAAGRAQDCLIQPNQVPKEVERGTYSLALVPLAAPQPLSSSPPIGLPAAASQETSATIPGFRLPQSAGPEDQRRGCRRRPSIIGPGGAAHPGGGSGVDRQPPAAGPAAGRGARPADRVPGTGVQQHL